MDWVTVELLAAGNVGSAWINLQYNMGTPELLNPMSILSIFETSVLYYDINIFILEQELGSSLFFNLWDFRSFKMILIDKTKSYRNV